MFREANNSLGDFIFVPGLLLRTTANPRSNDEVTYAPFTLFPHPVPEECFDKACRVQQCYNLLVHQVAQDHDFLEMCLSEYVTTYSRFITYTLSVVKSNLKSTFDKFQ